MSALTAPVIAPKTSDWLPVSTPRELGIGDVVVIRKKLHPCKDGTERHGRWSKKHYEQSSRKQVEVQISGRIVRSYVETDQFLKGLTHVLEPTALSMPTPGEKVPAGIRIPLHQEIRLHPKFYENYQVRRSKSRSPSPDATDADRHKFMGELLKKAVNGNLNALAKTVDPWDGPPVRLGLEGAKNLLTSWGWPRIREHHIRQCDGRSDIPPHWGETWSPPPKKIEPFDHRLIPDDDGPPRPPTPPKRIRSPEELADLARRRAAVIAEAEADPEVAAIMAALPGCLVREVRLRSDPDEDETEVELVEDGRPVKADPVDHGELVDLEQPASQGSEFAEAPPEEVEQEHDEQAER